MAKKIQRLNIELDGIGHTVSDNKLIVPIYQRSYAWEEKHVNDLYTDLFTAIRNSEDEYFIGSIVISSNNSKNEVIDGQQRLATISILIAAIRDYFHNSLDENRAEDIQNKYLSSRDIRTQEIIPSLHLNNNDHDFYYKHVVLKPGSPGKEVEPKRESHERIKKAYSVARKTVKNFLTTTNNPTESLLDLCEFIDENLKIIVVKVPDHANAYTIFETLNDRGLDLAISDLLKNFLLGQSEDRLNEVQSNWTEMYSVLENAENEDLVVTFFRQYWSSINGLTREREMYNKIKERITSKQKAVDLASNLAKASKVYVSLIDTNQTFWNSYSDEAKTHMSSLNLFGMVQLRPLLLAAMSNFDKAEIERTLKFLVTASVRFLIHGGLGGGALELQYSERAKEISSKEITNTKQLIEKMRSAIPTDAQFHESFKTASVSKQYLARYYLMVLEKCKNGVAKPELVPNPDTNAVNLEHIMPRALDSSKWAVDLDRHKLLINRIGNLAILSSKLNSEIGNASFADKRKHLSKSEFELTKSIALKEDWTEEQILERQTELADLAVKAWKII